MINEHKADRSPDAPSARGLTRRDFVQRAAKTVIGGGFLIGAIIGPTRAMATCSGPTNTCSADQCSPSNTCNNDTCSTSNGCESNACGTNTCDESNNCTQAIAATPAMYAREIPAARITTASATPAPPQQGGAMYARNLTNARRTTQPFHSMARAYVKCTISAMSTDYCHGDGCENSNSCYSNSCYYSDSCGTNSCTNSNTCTSNNTCGHNQCLSTNHCPFTNVV